MEPETGYCLGAVSVWQVRSFPRCGVHVSSSSEPEPPFEALQKNDQITLVPKWAMNQQKHGC